MTDEFKIYIDRLKGGHTQKIEGTFDPLFLDVEEEELQFEKPVSVRGEVYLTDDHLVIHLTASTYAEMPCAVCNQMVQVALSSHNFYHTEPLSEIPSAIYDFGAPLREALLLELPRTAECNQGHCPSRETLTPYMRTQKRNDQTTYFPFADIDLKN